MLDGRGFTLSIFGEGLCSSGQGISYSVRARLLTLRPRAELEAGMDSCACQLRQIPGRGEAGWGCQLPRSGGCGLLELQWPPEPHPGHQEARVENALDVQACPRESPPHTATHATLVLFDIGASSGTWYFYSRISKLTLIFFFLSFFIHAFF